MKDEKKDFNIEVKREFDELEKRVGKAQFYNLCLYRAVQLKSELIPKVVRCLN